jgi:hypothetical protein
MGIDTEDKEQDWNLGITVDNKYIWILNPKLNNYNQFTSDVDLWNSVKHLVEGELFNFGVFRTNNIVELHDAIPYPTTASTWKFLAAQVDIGEKEAEIYNTRMQAGLIVKSYVKNKKWFKAPSTTEDEALENLADSTTPTTSTGGGTTVSTMPVDTVTQPPPTVSYITDNNANQNSQGGTKIKDLLLLSILMGGAGAVTGGGIGGAKGAAITGGLGALLPLLLMGMGGDGGGLLAGLF